MMVGAVGLAAYAQAPPKWRGPYVITQAGELIQIDCAVRESHRTQLEITDVPVESGSNVSDSSHTLPDSYDLNGILSDETPTPAIDRYNALLVLQKSRDVCTVVTGLRVYEQAIFETIEIVRDESGGSIIEFNASARTIQFADSQTIVLKADKPKVKKLTDTGPQTPKPKPELRSTLRRITDATGATKGAAE